MQKVRISISARVPDSRWNPNRSTIPREESYVRGSPRARVLERPNRRGRTGKSRDDQSLKYSVELASRGVLTSRVGDYITLEPI
jgi:hypothetical protein